MASEPPVDGIGSRRAAVGASIRGSRAARAFGSVLRMTEIGPLAALLGVAILLAIASPYFLTSRNLFNVVKQISVVGVVTLGATVLMAAGEVDLSVGQLLSFSAAFMAILMEVGVPPAIAIVGGLALGSLVGLTNGLIVTKLKVNSFIVTLGMLSVARGFALLITGGLPLSMPPVMAFFYRGKLGPLPVPGLLLLGLAVAAHLFLSRTVTGRNIYAVGSNPRAARLSGIDVPGTKRLAFIIQGFAAAVGALILAGNLAMADPVMGTGLELDVIAAAVIGGASLAGGAGTILGSLVGACLMGVLRNGFVLLGISTFWQVVTIGLVIILAVAMDQLRRR